MRKLVLGAALLASATAGMMPSVAGAQRYQDRYERSYDGDDWRDYDDRDYDRRPQRCSKGTTGALIGAIAGGLLGRTIDSRGDRALGTILGGGAGALAGHAVEKSNNPGYCR